LGFEHRILGPLEVARDGEAVRVGGRKQRMLLALLVLEAGAPVPADRLIEALWQDYDPAAPGRLQVMVSLLRKALGDRDAITMRDGGYVVGGSVDATRFEALARSGGDALAAGDAEQAAATLRDALALWRGPALGDLADEPSVRGAAGRLEALRLVALEGRLEADLALGRHRELVPELEALVAEHPLRERLRGALMLALYRAGRQADALDAYLAARRTLVDELGVEPGPALRDLHAAILRQDGTLVVERPEIRARRHLPAPATSLIGRRAQLDEVVALLRRDGVRLVTLTGPGGTGKTRLSIQAGAELAEDFGDGVYFTPLAIAEDPELVPEAIAGALELEEQAGQDIVISLQAHLGDRQLLLVLDNFEHVDAAAPVVSRLLEAAAGVKVLATSRAPLRLYGEHVYPVPPLDAGEAADLFVARAQAARHGFVAHAEVVDEICARLDGLPLAIELAAARSRALSLDEMLASLAQRLRLAAHGPRDLPERQQTLRAALDWSHRLLSERERELFARLGVFVGGWDAGAARQVCEATADELDALAEQSLVRRAGERFEMLETVREYAVEHLGDEEPPIRAAHAAHFAALAEEAAPLLTADRQGTWLQRLETEHANLRAAITWSARAGERELELRLVIALTRFWLIRGHLREGRAWIDAALARGDGQPPALRAQTLEAGARIALSQGDHEAMQRFAGEGLALYEQLGDERGTAQLLDRLATATANLGDNATSAALYDRSLAIWRELGDARGLAVATTNIGCLALMDGDLVRAETLSREGLALYERIGDREGMLQPLNNLGYAALLRGDHADAAAIFRESIALGLELGYQVSVAYSCEGLAAVHSATGEPERAAAMLGAGAAAAEKAGMLLEPFELEIHDRTVDVTRAALGDAAYASAFAAGRERDLSAF
jgi:predicted ATPase/DNA-binding SARP family transcriptional activator